MAIESGFARKCWSILHDPSIDRQWQRFLARAQDERWQFLRCGIRNISSTSQYTTHIRKRPSARGAARRFYARVGKKLSVCEGSAKKRKLTAKTIITYSMLGSGDNFRRFFCCEKRHKTSARGTNGKNWQLFVWEASGESMLSVCALPAPFLRGLRG